MTDASKLELAMYRLCIYINEHHACLSRKLRLAGLGAQSLEIRVAADELLVDIDVGHSTLAVQLFEISLDVG
jgi:hypothetical protein